MSFWKDTLEELRKKQKDNKNTTNTNGISDRDAKFAADLVAALEKRRVEKDMEKLKQMPKGGVLGSASAALMSGNIPQISVQAGTSENPTWFKSSQSDNVISAILSSGTDLLTDITAGALEVGEKIVDAGAVVGANLNNNPTSIFKQLSDEAKRRTSGQLTYEELFAEYQAELAENKGNAKETARIHEKYRAPLATLARKKYEDKQKGVKEQTFSADLRDDYSKWKSQKDKETAETIDFVKKDLYNSNELISNILGEDFMNRIEANSVFGDKTDALAQSAGQMGVNIGLSFIPGIGQALSMANTGLTSFGGEVENALRQGASLNEATLSAAVSAAGEVLTEKFLGSFSFGGKTIDDVLLGKLSKNISSKIARSALKLGLGAAGEGFEEILSGVISDFGQKISYAPEKEIGSLAFWNWTEEQWDEFVGGAVLGGLMGSAEVTANAISGIDPVTGFNKNEQTVFNSELENRIKEKEKSGEKVTAKDKANIYDEVMRDFENGRISTDTIEELLAEDEYKAYKDALEKENAAIKEYDDILNTKESEITVAQRKRLDELESSIKYMRGNAVSNAAKAKLDEKISGLTENTRLAESFNERARRGQAFEVDLNTIDAKYRDTYKRAAESGILNNTNRTRELVGMIAKISADKGVTFDFVNNQKLKESGFALGGKTVNGYITKDGNIAVNIQSAKSLNSVVGHEVTHILQEAGLDGEFKDAIIKYATSKGEYQSRYDAAAELYNGITEDIEGEVVADLVGDYLFTDADFITRLATQNRNVFQKIYDEIKYMLKVATAGSKEARQLEKVKKLFDKAYKETANMSAESDNTQSGDVQYSVSDNKNIDNYTESQYNNFGWVRGNDIVSAGYWKDFTSKFAAAKSNQQKFNKTQNGEYIIPANDLYNEGVNNVLFYASGSITSPKVSKVVKINLSSETALDVIRSDIYESKGILREDYFNGLLAVYDAEDFPFRKTRRTDYGQSGKIDGRNEFGRGTSEEIRTDADESSVSKTRFSISDTVPQQNYGNLNIRGEDVAIAPIRQDIAPVASRATSSVAIAPIREDIAPTANRADTVSDIAPLPEQTANTTDYIGSVRADLTSQTAETTVAPAMADSVAPTVTAKTTLEAPLPEDSNAKRTSALEEARKARQDKKNGYISELKSYFESLTTEEAFDEAARIFKENRETFQNINRSNIKDLPQQIKDGYYKWQAIKPYLEDIMGRGGQYNGSSLANWDANVGTTSTDDIAPLPESATASTLNTANGVTGDIAPLPDTAQNTTQGATANGKQRRWIETSTESETVKGNVLPEDLDVNAIYYEPISNKKTMNNANRKYDSLGGYEQSVAYFNNQMESKNVSLDDLALGERLIKEAASKGDTQIAAEMIQNVSILGTELGQKVQALSLIQRMTPEGQLTMLQKVIRRGKARGDKAFETVQLTPEMMDKILSAYGKDGTYDQNKLNEVVDEVKQQIADQMKVTAQEKINAWRYLSMLGNPKTHIRNIVSNVAMQGTVAVKNVMAATVEDIAAKKLTTRTKTLKRATKEVKAFAEQTTLDMIGELSGENKYSEATSIKNKRQTFGNKALNTVYEFNNKMLSNEDLWFKKHTYRHSLSNYLTANGIRTTEDIKNNPKIVEKAKQYAMEQALIATFQQYSYLASTINKIENKNAALNVAIGAIMPFKKTPINIAKTGLSYSALGAAKSLTYDIYQVKKGNMEASQMIDNLCQGLTGTAISVLGYILASAGLLNGAGEDDKEGKYDYQLGEQTYSVNIGGNTYSLSWLSPVAMPLFVGANAYELLTEERDWDGNIVVEALAKTLDPLSEMSFVSGLTDVLSSYDSGTKQIAGSLESAAQNYITQFVPTLLSQIASVTDDTKRSTKGDDDGGWSFIDETLNKIKYKVPGLRQTLEPSLDIGGNEIKQTENVALRAFETFIAPYGVKNNITSAIDTELKSLYNDSGETGVLPSVPYDYINFKDVKYEMSSEDFTAYKKTYGQTSYNMLRDLFATSAYKSADSATKADMVERVYSYARDEAKKEYLASKNVEYTNATENNMAVYKEDAIKGAIANDMTIDEYKFYSDNPEKYKVSQIVTADFSEYMDYKKALDGIKAGDNTKDERTLYIDGLDLDYGQKIILFRSYYPKDDTYNKDIVEYLNGRNDISYEKKIDILNELGFTVASDGKVGW